MLKIGIAGAAGRMGNLLMEAVRENQMTILSAISARGDDVEQLNTYLQREGLVNVVLTSEARNLVESSDAVIDFTAPEYSLDIAKYCAELGKTHICGTTGFSEDQKITLLGYAKQTRIVWAANFSIGVNLLSILTKQAAKSLGLDYDIEILEMHHRHKKDAPSGTALALGEAAASGREQSLSEAAIHGRNGLVGERPRGEIGFHAVRGGDVIGDHNVIFACDGERVELAHKSSSRRIYADGAIKAALWAAAQPNGLYSMQDVLNS
jgi:4-hydroxy-tetrahydrodipicolinate reductase